MPPLHPPVEPRDAAAFAAALEAGLAGDGVWTPPPGRGDPGTALVRVFARMAEVVAARLNQVPDRNFLAFLDLIGTELLPPQPARVPLTFALAAGSPVDALVPARTPVAALPLEGETEPVVFETERELVVTRSRLVAAWVRDPARDRRTDATSRATGEVALPFRVFEGERETGHRVAFGDREAFGREGASTVTLVLAPIDPVVPWPAYAEWEARTADGWTPLPRPAVTLANGRAEVVFTGFAGLPLTELAGRTSAWISARLPVALRERGVVPEWWHDTAAEPESGWAPYRMTGRARPLGEHAPRKSFYLAADDVSRAPGAFVRMRVETDLAHPAVAGQSGVELAWEYFQEGPKGDGSDDRWVEIGRSSPTDDAFPGSAPDFSDGTRALRLDGVVTFRVPARWKAAQVNHVTRRWLRVRVAGGGYGEGDDFRPPTLERVRLDADLAVPALAEAGAATGATVAAALPDAVLAGGSVIDPGRDFLPFGERPRLGDTFYFASRALAGAPGADVTLRITLTNPDDESGTPLPAEAHDVVLAWEFWNRESGRWELLGRSGGTPDATYGFEDGSAALTAHDEDGFATVTFTRPATMGETEVDGRTAYWVRVRLSGGNYGKDAFYTEAKDASGNVIKYPETDFPIYRLEPASFRPPSVRALEIDVEHEVAAHPVDAVVTENDDVVADHTKTIADGGSFTPFVLSADTEPALYLGFERPGSENGFDNRAVTLFLAVAEATYDDADPDRRTQGRPDVVWEYRTARGWARLGARDETAGLTRRGTLTFIGPPDFRASTELGRTAFWLRARLAEGGHVVPPALTRVLTNTVWATHATEIVGETLGSGNGERGQRFRATRAPVLPDEALEVREAELPTPEERARIEAEEGPDALRVVADTAGRPVEVWVRWHRVPDFHGSGPRDRHYTLDRRTGEVAFGDGRQGMAPPQGRANVRLARYRTGGGPAGNRPAGSVTQLRVAVPYVDAATNLFAAAGGTAGETLAEARERGPRALRHRGRAVAIADFEDLAREASPEVALAQGVPPRTAEEAGSVALVIVPRSADPRPVPSLELLARVRDYVGERLCPTVDLVVQGPEWVAVSVSAEVAPAPGASASEVHAVVLRRLAAFLHPLTGGVDGRGWPFGRKPHRSDLFALLEAAPGVDHVRSLRVTETGAPQSDRFLVHAGAHRITVSGLAGQ